jgi:hypothetical protein
MNANKFIKSLPLPLALLKGPDLRLDMANAAMLSLLDRPAEVINTPLLEFMPELIAQVYPSLLKEVMKSGEVHQENGARVLIVKQGVLQSVYLDYSFTPISVFSSRFTAVVVAATEICKKNLARLVSEESDRNLRNLVYTAPVPMCVFKGKHLEVEIVNDAMLDVWQNKRYREMNALEHVFHNAVPYVHKENNITYTLSPIVDLTGSVKGVMLIATLQP